MARKFITHQEALMRDLKNNSLDSKTYLNELIAGFGVGGERVSRNVILRGLRNIVQAKASYKKIAAKVHINHETLQEILSESGNPRLSSLIKVLHGLNFEAHVIKKEYDPDYAIEEEIEEPTQEKTVHLESLELSPPSLSRIAL